MYIYWGDACSIMYLFLFTTRACHQRHLKTTKWDDGANLRLLPCDLWPASHSAARPPSSSTAWLTQQELSSKDSPRFRGQALVPPPAVTWLALSGFFISLDSENSGIEERLKTIQSSAHQTLLSRCILILNDNFPGHHHGKRWEQSCSRYRVGGQVPEHLQPRVPSRPPQRPLKLLSGILELPTRWPENH